MMTFKAIQMNIVMHCKPRLNWVFLPLILCFCWQGNLIETTFVFDGPQVKNPDREIFNDKCETLLAEVYFTKSPGYSYLNQKVNTAKKLVEIMRAQQKKSGN
jgi:hypothetical protein